MKATIYTAYHMAAPVLESASIVPIHVGRARARTPLPDMIGDDTGDHISSRNDTYCELTALYWAWKNGRASDYVGLMHYRRVLDLTGRRDSPQTEQFLDRFDIREWTAEAEDWIARTDVDLVVPRMHTMALTVEQNYARGHKAEDFALTRAVVAERHPDWLADFDAMAAGTGIRLANMFLMRRDLFEDYCAFAFDILEQVDARGGDRRAWYSMQDWRYLGFIAERLFTLYVTRIMRDRPELKVRKVNILNIGRAAVTPYISGKRLTGPEHVNIAFSADRAYLPHTAAMLRSMVDHVSPERQYNLFFLQSGVGAKAMEALRTMLAPFPNVALHAIDVGDRFADAHRSATRAPSNATYNRFLLFDLLPDLERLLYLDVDMIVRGDVAEIFDADIGDAAIAAVPDFIMTRTLTGRTPTIDPDVPDLGAYQRDTLKMTEAQISRYFNAGLLLFNFAAMDTARVGRDLMKMAASGRYLFRDQDILNSYFRDRYLPLPAKYNVFNTIASGYGRVPRDNHEQALAAKRDPFIVHFAAGDYKPWDGATVPWADLYWQSLIRTPFYGEVIGILREVMEEKHRRGFVRRQGRALIETFPALRPGLMSIYRGLSRVRRLR
ncbi:DUF4422 domain-containing protein [Palleronia sediminis]|uniref:DUF4422 domain-containing protein n=1 Tax=Palleronia sediminis TaxID=2547833 RepID=A0A4R6AEA9_9RHOB|nr:DUF4422 domain-containing protein [Palleronia sediminis]TDL81567.1 DUF4422 domain-containing protein [Palleronia sediminis]